MDREQDELQFLGIIGIYKESFNIIYKWRKIFTQITLTFIIPLSFLFLGHIAISDDLVSRIIPSKDADVTNTAYWLFKAAYFTLMLIFGLLSTSAVVYTIASVYTSNKIIFKKIISVVPRVWKRVMVTFLCTFMAFFLYNVVSLLVLYGLLILFAESDMPQGEKILLFLLILYIVGFVYMTIIWQLASVVSVLEETRGFKAIIKSKKLLKGNTWVATIIFFKLNFLAFSISFLFQEWVVGKGIFNLDKSLTARIGFGILCLLLLFKLILFLLVIQTVLYFVCKSYHHENIDKSALADHLEVIYMGDYLPLKSKDVQLA